MSKYFIEHVPYAECFSVYKRSWFIFKELQKNFYYEYNASVEQIRQAKKRAQDFIEILKEQE